MTPWTPRRARLLATFAHDGQVDAGGTWYIAHPSVVASMARARAERDGDLDPDVVEMVGWLHDVVEDTPVTLEDLHRFSCPQEVLYAVGAITKRPEEATLDYYARVKRNPYALAVKRADVEHNADPDRLAKVAETDPERAARLAAKYARAREALGA